MFGMIPYPMTLTHTRELPNLFSDEFTRAFFGNAPKTMKVDLKDDGDSYLLEAELPGMNKEDVRVEVEDGVLTISAETKSENEETQENTYLCRERTRVSAKRSFRLEGVREEEITGEYRDGVLRLTLPKETETHPARREIAIA